MKQWVVRMSDGDSGFIGAGVFADYMKHEQGALVFKAEKPGTYPEMVKIFAPGVWREVTLIG